MPRNIKVLWLKFLTRREIGVAFKYLGTIKKQHQYDLAKFSNSQQKNQGFGRAERAQTPDFFVKLAKPCIKTLH
jgi:hypothetical protein